MKFDLWPPLTDVIFKSRTSCIIVSLCARAASYFFFILFTLIIIKSSTMLQSCFSQFGKLVVRLACKFLAFYPWRKFYALTHIPQSTVHPDFLARRSNAMRQISRWSRNDDNFESEFSYRVKAAAMSRVRTANVTRWPNSVLSLKASRPGEQFEQAYEIHVTKQISTLERDLIFQEPAFLINQKKSLHYYC